MNVAMLLEMASEGFGDRVAFGSPGRGITYSGMFERARRVGSLLQANERKIERAVLVDVNSEAVPLLLFGSALASIPFVPLSYRLAPEALHTLLERTIPSLVVVGEDLRGLVAGVEGVQVLGRGELLGAAGGEGGILGAGEGLGGAGGDDIAVLLFTSGTTGEPKAAVLRHRHLVSYVISTVEYMGAGEDECTLVSVPPYHVAGIAAVLNSVYAGRRLVQLDSFTPEGWVELAIREGVTHAMVVPTMLARIVEVVRSEGAALPRLRHLSYGGGRMPLAVLEQALDVLPGVDFVNAYGLTETSSTISVLGPEDHRLARRSEDPEVRRRLASVGRPLPGIELQIRDHAGRVLGPGEAGEIWVRGEQVAGEYLGEHLGEDVRRPSEGWFATKDAGWIDEHGYLYVEGRLDDVIVRGGENLSPVEIEEALIAHPGVAEAAAVGVPDTEWGEKVPPSQRTSFKIGSGVAYDPLGPQSRSYSSTRSPTTRLASCCAGC
jgi:fatty-acyl-CoA synthase